MKRFVFGFALFFFLFFLIELPVAHAETVTLTPSDDTYIDQGNPTTKYYNYSRLTAALYYGENRATHILLKFNLASIPSGATINSAKLRLYQTNFNGAIPTAYLEIWHVYSNWSESTVIWANNPSYTAFEYVSSISSSVRDYQAFDVTGIVRSWLDNTSNNYGIYLRPNGPSNVTWAVSFGSKESSTKPQLVIDYSVPSTINYGVNTNLFSQLVNQSQSEESQEPTATPTYTPTPTPTLIVLQYGQETDADIMPATPTPTPKLISQAPTTEQQNENNSDQENDEILMTSTPSAYLSTSPNPTAMPPSMAGKTLFLGMSSLPKWSVAVIMGFIFLVLLLVGVWLLLSKGKIEASNEGNEGDKEGEKGKEEKGNEKKEEKKDQSP